MLEGGANVDLTWLGWLVIGLIAGLLSGYIVGGRTARGILPSLIVGIIGGFLGGWVAGLVGVTGISGFFVSAVLATAGALLIRYVLKAFQFGD